MTAFFSAGCVGFAGSASRPRNRRTAQRLEDLLYRVRSMELDKFKD